MSEFKCRIKVLFTGDTSKTYSLPVRGLPDNEALGVKKQRIVLSRKDIYYIFEPVIHEILKLVVEHIQATAKKIKTVQSFWSADLVEMSTFAQGYEIRLVQKLK
jgi:hypothetical protein